MLQQSQVQKVTPSLIGVKGLGRLKEFTGNDEDFQKWSKNTETFFAGAIKAEMILEWSAEQVTEVTQKLIDLDFWPTSTNVEKGLSNLDYVLQQVLPAIMSLTSHEANDIVANSRKNEDSRNDMTRRQWREKLRTIISLGRRSLLKLQAGIER